MSTDALPGTDLLAARQAATRELQRRHVLEGFATVAADVGFAAATFTQIAAAARISKRTFYEHFADKEAAYLALHATVNAAAKASFAASWDRSARVDDWRERVRSLVHDYLECMASEPLFLSQVRIEPTVALTSAREVRDRAGAEWVDQWTGYFRELADHDREVVVPSPSVLSAAFAGVIHLVATAAGEGPAAVRALEDDVVDLMTCILTGPGRPA